MKQRLLVELDALLDTRLATIAQIAPALAVKAAESGYTERLNNDWDSLLDCSINDEFKRRYAQRDVETLKVSRCTASVLVVNEITQAWEDLAQNSPLVESYAVDINVYPYRLSEAELDAIVSAVLSYVSLDCQVEIVSYPPEALTPELIDKHWSILLLYDLDGWLNAQVERLKEKKIPAVTIVAPALYHDRIPGEEDLPKETLGNISPFAALELALVEYVSINLIDAKYFSILPI